jgi:hypothetical protein
MAPPRLTPTHSGIWAWRRVGVLVWFSLAQNWVDGESHLKLPLVSSLFKIESLRRSRKAVELGSPFRRAKWYSFGVLIKVPSIPITDFLNKTLSLCIAGIENVILPKFQYCGQFFEKWLKPLICP